MVRQTLRRNSRRWTWLLLPAILFIFALPFNANAQGFSVTVTVNENGNGNLTNTAGASIALPFSMQQDPGPGGFPFALTYSLLNPPGLVAGDVVLLEPGSLIISDLLRFNPQETCAGGAVGCLVFYSDFEDAPDALADIGIPTARYTNVLTLTEIGAEGNNGFTYTPTAGQPGFVAGAGGPVTYIIRSDTPSTVPEVSSLALLGFGFLGLGILFKKRSVMRD